MLIAHLKNRFIFLFREFWRKFSKLDQVKLLWNVKIISVFTPYLGTLCRELCKNGKTDQDALWDVDLAAGRRPRFNRGLGQILHAELHWLDVPDQVFFKLAVIVHRCLNGHAPLYLSDYCVPAAGADTRRQLRSSNRQLLAVPRYRLNTYGCRAFSVAGPHSLELSPGFYPGPDH